MVQGTLDNILLYGPAGTGKTTLAYAIAQVSLWHIALRTLFDKNIGNEDELHIGFSWINRERI